MVAERRAGLEPASRDGRSSLAGCMRWFWFAAGFRVPGVTCTELAHRIELHRTSHLSQPPLKEPLNIANRFILTNAGVVAVFCTRCPPPSWFVIYLRGSAREVAYKPSCHSIAPNFTLVVRDSNDLFKCVTDNNLFFTVLTVGVGVLN